MGIARAVFINRLDKEHADFDSSMAAIEAAFGHRVGAVQLPIGREADFKGVVDIIRMKAYHHEGEKEEVFDIPADMTDAADSAREKLTELVAEADDALMEKYLEGERLSQEELEQLLGLAIAQSIFIPVFVGSATALQGVEDLMDEIVGFFPQPTAHGPLKTIDGTEVPFSTSGESRRPRLQDTLRPLCGTHQLRQGGLGDARAQRGSRQFAHDARRSAPPTSSRRPARRWPTSTASLPATSRC